MVFEQTMERWWGRAVFGVIAVVFGLAFLLVPGFTLTLFLLLFGFFMIVSGIVLIGFSRYRVPGTRRRTLNVIEGLVAIAIGVIAILAPGISALWAIYLVAVFAIISGLLQIAEGLMGPRRTTTMGASNRWLLVISGAISLVIGIAIVFFPGSGILAILWIIGIFLIVVGAINIVAGIRMRAATAGPVTAP